MGQTLAPNVGGARWDLRAGFLLAGPRNKRGDIMGTATIATSNTTAVSDLSEEASSLYKALWNMSKSKKRILLPDSAITLMNRLLNGKLAIYLHELSVAGLISYEISDTSTVTFLPQDQPLA
jgi:hypothetical protein